MDLQAFKKTLSDNLPPDTLKPHLKALWYDGKNDWEMQETQCENSYNLYVINFHKNNSISQLMKKQYNIQNKMSLIFLKIDSTLKV